MKRHVLLLCACCFAGHAHADEWVISPSGFGPVKVGMSVEQAEQQLGSKLVPDGEGANSQCYHVHAAHGHEGLQFMVLEDKIARASIYVGPSPIRTDRGIGIGDHEEDIRKAYDTELETKPHAYGSYPNDKYLTYWTADKKNGVRYETYEGRVVTIHGGTASIRYIEGCS